MVGVFKALLGGPYSYDDLLKASMPFLANPKMPDGWEDVPSMFDGKTRTFIEYVTLAYKDFLKHIASKSTRAEQKKELLALHIQQLTWVSTEKAARDAKWAESWAHYTKGHPLFDMSRVQGQMLPQAEWKFHLSAQWLTSIILTSWLKVLGRDLYQLEPHLEAAFDLYQYYDTEIKTMEVGMRDLMFEKLANYEDDEGKRLASFLDGVLTPLVKEQYAILDRLEADIRANTLDLAFYKSQFTRIDELKQFIARTVAAGANPNQGTADMDTDIFISYRRDDEPAFVRRLYDLLKSTFPHHKIFIDVDGIPPGDRFQGHIVSRVVKCSAFIPIIGPKWLYPTGAASSRLFETDDMVRKEIESAIVCECAILPILVNDTRMPRADDIPRSISGLCALNAVQIREASLEVDAKPLVRALRSVIKHHVEKHFTVGEYEAYELGKQMSADMSERISKGVRVTFDGISAPMEGAFYETTRGSHCRT